MKPERLLLATITALVLISAAMPTTSAELTNKDPIPDIPLKEDEVAVGEINLNNHFSDGDSQISYSSVSAHNKIEVTIHDDGSVDFSPPKDWFGTDEVTFLATDGEQQASDTIYVVVEPQNDPVQLLTPIPDLTFEEDRELKGAINLNNHFWDIDSTLIFSHSSESLTVQIRGNGDVDILAPKDWYGAETVTFFASDDEFEVIEEVIVTVTPVNDAPKTAANLVSISLNAESSITLKLSDYFTDVDNDDLTYEISGNNRIKADFDPQKGKLILNAPKEWSGEELITLSASDSSGGTSSVQLVVITTGGTDSSGQVFYLLGLVLAVALIGVRLQVAGRKRIIKSPVKLENYRHYRGK
ncbi:MAG: hypothetical protein JSV09_06075 [Thermoplasmata archaeon]|nr:MAG: hypothetical protein JSV09_06075 [Thermoplasmata archaeon]